MKPILYGETETTFTTQGYGVLYDTISCEVTEERNGAFELKLVYDINGIHFSDIKNDRIILAKPNDSDDPQPFRIYRITKPMNGRVTVYGEHLSYQLSKIPVEPFTASNVQAALLGLSDHAIISCPFIFWTNKDTEANFSVKEPASIRSRLGGTQGSILDVYGGEWKFDKFTVRLYNNRGADNGVLLRYGKNITSLTQEENIQNTCTGIVPIWVGTSEENEDILVTLDDYVVYADNHQSFPYEKVIVVDLSDKFETEPTQAQLRSAAQTYITSNNIGVPSVSIEVSFAALWQTEEYKEIANLERVRLCDTVTVDFEQLGIAASAKVVKTVYDVLSERYSSVTLGEVRANFADTVQKSKQETLADVKKDYASLSFLERAVNHATALITGGLGGYVFLKPNANGEPEEILILGDSPDYTQAQKVWRWNKNGLGYSSTGYEGSFGTAITNDGHIVADFMDTGTLNAGLITVIHLSASSIDTGALTVKDANNNVIFLADVSNKTVAIKGEYVTLGNLSLAAAIDDTIDTTLTQQEVFNRLTNNGAAQGLALINGQLYMSFSYAQGGTLTLGGQNNGNGLMVVKNASNVEIGRWDNTGIQITRGVIKLGNAGNNAWYTQIDDNGRIDTAKLYATYGSLGDMVLEDSSLKYGSPVIPQTYNVNSVYMGKYGVCIGGKNQYNYGSQVIIQEGKFSLWQEISLNGNSTEIFRIQGGANSAYSAASVEIYLGKPEYLTPTSPKRFFYGDCENADVYIDNMITLHQGSYTLDFGTNSVPSVGGDDGLIVDAPAIFERSVMVDGSLTVIGSKNRLVETDNYSDRLLYCYEMSSPMFGDIGEGVISDDGFCYVQIDPVFAETISTNQYQVFLQRYGAGDCFVLERHASYFVVEGTPGLEFGWEMKAKQSDFDQRRLDKPDTVNILNNYDYTKDAEDHIISIYHERGLR